MESFSIGLSEHASPVGELDPEYSTVERVLPVHRAMEKELLPQHKECDLDQCLVCKILTLGIFAYPSVDPAGLELQKNGWCMDNNRQSLRHIQKQAANGCMISTCLLAGTSLLLGADQQDYERQFHFGYNGKFGSLYVIPNQFGGGYPPQLPESWFWDHDRVDIFPLTTKPYFWRGLAKVEFGNLTHNGTFDASFDFTRSCLEECLKTHRTCWQGGPFMPKRLLQIEKYSHKFRLITPNLDPPRVYAALSYCWGASKPLNTTRSTLHLRERGIDWIDLPHTYQDAATVCIRLGIDYLWIDALCIVQDDKEDWADQCPQMAQIYRSAYITIAAASSVGCQESFLAAPRQSPIVIETETADGYPSSVYIRRRIRSGIHYNEKQATFEGSYLTEPGSYGQVEPLEKRGWTLQEQDLASRRVVYVSGEVQWVCRTMTRCECLPKRRGLGQDFAVTPESAHFRWTETAHRLSTRRFTYEKDKLPALSGIASEVYHATQSKYLAGLWMNDIQRQLPWFTIAPKPFPESYIAPSFSWASVSSEVFWPHMMRLMAKPLEGTEMENPEESQVQYLVTDISGDCSLSTSDRFGQVLGGFIKLSGRIIDSYIRSSPKFEIGYDSKYSNLEYGGLLCADGPLKQTMLSSRGKSLITVQRSDKEKGQSFDWTPVKLLFLQRRCTTTSSADEPLGSFCFDAIVLGVSKLEPEYYQRLGLVINIRLKDKSGDKDLIEDREECIVIS